MTYQIKFKILKLEPDTHSVLVNYYTDELVEAMHPTWESRVAQLMRETPDRKLNDALAQAQKEYIPGGVWNVTIYPDPAPQGQELIDYISSYAPKDWLEHKTKLALHPRSMENIQALVGTEHVVKPLDPDVSPEDRTIPTL